MTSPLIAAPVRRDLTSIRDTMAVSPSCGTPSSDTYCRSVFNKCMAKGGTGAECRTYMCQTSGCGNCPVC